VHGGHGFAGRPVEQRALHEKERALSNPLVDHVMDPMARDNGTGGCERTVQHEMFLAMHRHPVIHAGVVIAQQERLEAEHHWECRQHLQVLLVDEGEFARVERIVAETDAKRVEDHVLFGVALLRIGDTKGEQLVRIDGH
jgi:hypothetical protein